jgi:DNA-binding CsgD family transcriptional regulator
MATQAITNGARQRIFSDQEWADLMRRLDMSRRQVQILNCLFSGLSDKQMALAIGIAPATVRTHLGRLFFKTHTQDRIGLLLHIFAYYRNLPPTGSALPLQCPTT